MFRSVLTCQGANYRLKEEDISYIFQHSGVEVIIVDQEFEPLLKSYRSAKPNIPIIVDTDTDATEGELSGPFDGAVLEGLKHDAETGATGWEGLESQAVSEDDIIALAYTSGTTARPKGVEYTHRGCYLAAMGNVIESGLNSHRGRCRYLWTLPMFHAMGASLCIFPWYSILHQHILLTSLRLDVPMGCYCCPRHPLLPAKD